MMKVVLYDNRDNSPTKGLVNEFFMGDHQQILVRIPPMVITVSNASANMRRS